MITLHENCYYSPVDVEEILKSAITYKTTTKTNKQTYYEDIFAFDIESTSYSFKLKNETDADIYNYIKGSTIRITNAVYLELADFNDIRKSLFGKIFFSKNRGVYIDSFYMELSNLFPYEFPTDVTNEIDQLEIIIKVFSENIPGSEKTIKTGLMYCWQFAINGYVVIGRTWNEFVNMCKLLSNFLGLSDKKRCIFWVHNLSFELQFIKDLFTFTKVFAVDNRKPVYAITDLGIEFRCSYILSNYSLGTLAENLLYYDIRKLKDDFDYSLLRHEETPLTEAETHYCINDVLIVSAFIQEEIRRNKSITNIPLTATGYARKYISNSCLNRANYAKYSKYIHSMVLSDKEYIQWRRCFQGGFTHTSIRWINKTINMLSDSFDYISSYPYTMISEANYPVSSGRSVNVNSIAELEDYMKYYCCIFDIELHDVKPKISNENFLAYYKCFNVKNGINNNGRLVMADSLCTTLNEVDYKTIKMFYTWNEKKVKIKNLRIYDKGYLPKEIIEAILTLYEQKTQLKGVEGKEEIYQHSKALLNACYGLLCMRIDRPMYKYDNIKGWYKEDSDLIKVINKYNDSKKRFSFYPWSCYVTSLSRANLARGIIAFGDDYIYSDTDSIKCVNAKKHLDFIESYNKEVEKKLKKMCEHYNIDFNRCKPKTIKGEEKLIGIWEYETKNNPYTKFKALGAKRYMYEQKNKDGESEIHITIAGVSKKEGAKYISKFADPFKNFTYGLKFPANTTGKLTHLYVDDPIDFIMTDYKGNTKECSALSGVYLEEASYNMSISKDLREYILYATGELIT